jgi:hypothetical protein
MHFLLTERGSARVSVVNLLGTEVTQFFTGDLDAGEHSFTWDAIGVPPGRYLCTIRSNGRVEQIPMLLVR